MSPDPLPFTPAPGAPLHRAGARPGRALRIAIATSRRELPAGDRELQNALIRLGHDVHGEIWHDPGPAWPTYDAVIVRSCWDYHLRAREFLDWIALLERAGVGVVNPPELIRWNADKVYLAGLAADGIAIPDTVFVERGTQVDLAAACTARGWHEAVVKPNVSASAHRTERRSTGHVAGPALIQQYIEAIETQGEWSLVYFGGRFSHAVIKKPNHGYFRVQAEFGGTVEVARPPQPLRQFAERVLRRVAQPAPFARVDVVADGRSILLMELEVIEPELFMHLAHGSADRLAAVVSEHLRHVRAGGEHAALDEEIAR